MTHAHRITPEPRALNALPNNRAAVSVVSGAWFANKKPGNRCGYRATKIVILVYGLVGFQRPTHSENSLVSNLEALSKSEKLHAVNASLANTKIS